MSITGGGCDYCNQQGRVQWDFANNRVDTSDTFSLSEVPCPRCSPLAHSDDFNDALERVRPILGGPRTVNRYAGYSVAYWHRGRFYADGHVGLPDEDGHVTLDAHRGGDLRMPYHFVGGKKPTVEEAEGGTFATPEDAARACAAFLGWEVSA
mgnify:CR=1 FL=1